MTDAPERIWVAPWPDGDWSEGDWDDNEGKTLNDKPCIEYVRADRIEQLAVTNEALTAKLAKTAKVALAYEDWVTDAYDLLEERREEFDPESPSDKAIMDLMDKAEAGIARATLAEIKGESHE